MCCRPAPHVEGQGKEVVWLAVAIKAEEVGGVYTLVVRYKGKNKKRVRRTAVGVAPKEMAAKIAELVADAKAVGDAV